MSEEIYLADWEEEALRRAEKERESLEEERSRESQFSIADPPDRDHATSQPAKAKDSAAAAGTALSAEIRRRLDRLLKKND